MDDEPAEEPDAGIPAWVMTFADLMSLLMCFFVLLLSFSEMDVAKYKQLAGSMQNAFGVQRDFKVREIPKGTSVIAKEFSPGKPQPTIKNEVRQMTTNDKKRYLKVGDKLDSKTFAKKDGVDGDLTGKGAKSVDPEEDSDQDSAEIDAQRVVAALEDEILASNVEVETRKQRIIIRILERGAFTSGASELQPEFMQVLDKIRDVLITIEGNITVAGHTDNVPISTSRYRSNWDLSSARAASVAHGLMADGILAERKFIVSGYADSEPFVANDSPSNRAKNRRVEIVIVQGDKPSSTDAGTGDIFDTEDEDKPDDATNSNPYTVIDSP